MFTHYYTKKLSFVVIPPPELIFLGDIQTYYMPEHWFSLILDCI